jgi:hypothetical protein
MLGDRETKWSAMAFGMSAEFLDSEMESRSISPQRVVKRGLEGAKRFGHCYLYDLFCVSKISNEKLLSSATERASIIIDPLVSHSFDIVDFE